jgi:hypothetical protein
MSQIEQDFWKKTVIVLSIVSIIVGLVQRTQYRFLDPIFEFFIFHLTTISALLIYAQKK